MFQEKTYPAILQKMLGDVRSDVDTREGSIVYDALAPIAAMLAQFYVDLNTLAQVQDVLNAVGDDLDKKGFEFNVTRKEAVAAKRSFTVVGASATIGTRFLGDELFWVVTDDATVRCETLGTIGNTVLTGTQMIPLENIPGMSSAALGAIVVPGSERELDSEYRDKIIFKIRTPLQNSNKAEMQKWCEDVEGVGRVKVFPLDGGPNHVRVSILGSDMLPATSEVVSAVQEDVEPAEEGTGRHGLGLGKADIGLILNAEAATALNLSLSAEVQLAAGYTKAQAAQQIFDAVVEYLGDIAFIESQVKYNEISSKIYGTNAVLDFRNLTINGGTGNVSVLVDNVAILPNVDAVTVGDWI